MWFAGRNPNSEGGGISRIHADAPRCVCRRDIAGMLQTKKKHAESCLHAIETVSERFREPQRRLVAFIDAIGIYSHSYLFVPGTSALVNSMRGR